MPSSSQIRCSILKRKRKCSDARSDIENEPVREDKRARTEDFAGDTQLEDKPLGVERPDSEDANSGLAFDETLSIADERIPLTEISVVNLSGDSPTIEDMVLSLHYQRKTMNHDETSSSSSPSVGDTSSLIGNSDLGSTDSSPATWCWKSVYGDETGSQILNESSTMEETDRKSFTAIDIRNILPKTTSEKPEQSSQLKEVIISSTESSPIGEIYRLPSSENNCDTTSLSSVKVDEVDTNSVKSHRFTSLLEGLQKPCSSRRLHESPSSSSQSTSKFSILPGRFSSRTCPIPVLNWSEEGILWDFLCKKDAESVTSRNNYFSRHPGLQARMRSVLFEWLLEVCSVYKLQRETYYLAIDYIDRYLTYTSDISKKQLQLIGVTCLMISSKFEEIYPPRLSDFAYITDGACSESDILAMEMKIIKTLNWCTIAITSNSVMTIILQIMYQRDGDEKGLEMELANFPSRVFEKAASLLDLCTFDEGFLKYSYKTLAVTALYVSSLNKKTVSAAGMSFDHISSCISWMTPFWKSLMAHDIVQDPGTALDTVSFEKDETKKVSCTERDTTCKHQVNLQMLDAAQVLLKKESEADDSGFLTPPYSSSKKTE